MERRIQVCFNSWAGLTCVPAEIVSETPHRYKVRLLGDFPMRNWKTGDLVTVPKSACMSAAHSGEGE